MKKHILIPAIYASINMTCQITNEDNIEKKQEPKKLISDNEYKFEKPKSKYHK